MNYGLVLYVDCVHFLPQHSQFIASSTVSFHSWHVTFTFGIASLIATSLKSECLRPNHVHMTDMLELDTAQTSLSSADMKTIIQL